jgi:signal transduction histidine kinase/ligand-binding sensor domain-containing protein
MSWGAARAAVGKPRRGFSRMLVHMSALLLPFFAHAVAAEVEPTTPQGHYLFHSYGADDGLINSAVTLLLQDRQGFIWAGTDDGLYRYNGHDFERFGVDESTAVLALHEDAQGVLWVGTRLGLNRWNGSDFVPVPGSIASGDIINAIADTPEGLWLATASGLHIADQALAFRSAPDWIEGEATALWHGRTNTGLWVGHWDSQARILRRDASGWHSYAFGEIPVRERVKAIAEDGAGKIWARTATALWALDDSAQRFERVATPIPIAAEKHSTLAVGRRGDLWVANDAVMHRDNAGWTESLGGAVLGTRPVLEDREGSLWFGVRGLKRLAGRGIFHVYDINEGLPGTVVWSIARDRDKTLWVGTENGLARAVGERFEAIAGTSDHAIRSIATAADGRLFMAGIPAHEVLSYDPERGALRHHPLGSAIAPGRIPRLLLDRQGILWAGTDNAGLLQADTHDAELPFSSERLPRGTPEEHIGDIHEDAAGRIWVAGRSGLAMREHGNWRRFTTADGLRFDDTFYVRSTRNGDLLVVYGGSNGFARVRYEYGVLNILRHVDSASARSVDEIFIIGEDAQENVWVGTGHSIELRTPQRIEKFSMRDGLLGDDTASMAFLAEPNGDVWVGVVGGLMRFDAAAYRALPPRHPPPAALLEVRIGDRAWETTAQDVQVSHKANSFQARFAGLSFIGNSNEYKTRLFGLESAASIAESREVRYSALPPGSYRFEVAARTGPHDPWGAPASFSFLVMPAWWQTWLARALFVLAGVLVLLLGVRWRVAALEQHNRELEEHVTSRTAELCSTNTQLQSEIQDRIAAEHTVHERNTELEGLNHKLSEAHSQLLQSEKMASVGQLAAGVAHEINNPIGFVHANLSVLKQYVENIFQVLAVYGRIERALPDDHPELDQLRDVKRRIEIDYLCNDTLDLLSETLGGVTRVKKIVQDLKDFSHLDNAEWQRFDIHQCLDSTLNMIAHELKYKVDVIKEYGPLPPVRCLPFQLSQVFVNLLMNAAQAIEERGNVTIRTAIDGDWVSIAVSDTGKGIDPAHLRRIFEPFFTTKPVGLGTGLGLSVSYSIIQRHSGSIEAASQPGSGTTFTIRLPINGPDQAGERTAESATTPES